MPLSAASITTPKHKPTKPQGASSNERNANVQPRTRTHTLSTTDPNSGNARTSPVNTPCLDWRGFVDVRHGHDPTRHRCQQTRRRIHCPINQYGPGHQENEHRPERKLK